MGLDGCVQLSGPHERETAVDLDDSKQIELDDVFALSCRKHFALLESILPRLQLPSDSK